MFKPNPLKLAVAASLVTTSAWAEVPSSEEPPVIAAPVVVTATRIEQNSFDLPVSIDVVDQEDIQAGQLQSTLAESLIRVPGITAQNRTSQSQDPQISTRGFGSRSSFGVRGVRVYVDGIPLTMPDGQGQPGVVDLSAVKSIEVMRGPFSALYGNSSGGVVQMLTEDAPKTARVGGTVMFGSYDTQRQILDAAGTLEDIEYLLNVSNLETDGYRDHSAGKKEQATAKFKINFSEDTKLTTLVNWFDQEAQDPLGLPREAVTGAAAAPSAFEDREAAPNAAYNADTRVSRSHTQVGFNLSHAFNANNSLNLITYVGTRDNEQILPTNAAGTNARSSEISREFHGTDLRWDNKGKVFDMPYTLSLGTAYGRSEDDRTDTNVLSAGLPISTLNRDEQNISQNFDQYIQGKLSVLDNLDLHAGARHTKVKLKIEDNFTAGVGANGDNSGEVEYQDTTPVVGAVWKVTPTLNLFANYGEGFETPTFVEAAFATSDANSTPNLALKPSESRNYEIGAKAFLTANTQANLTFYHVKTDDEIVIQDNQNGRVSYTNANKTKRDGIEFSIDSQFANNISVFASYTLLDAKFDSDFTNRLGRTIESGNRIPGTYRTQLYGEVAWKYAPLGFHAALEGRHNSKVYVDDINSDSTSSYTIFNLRAGFNQKLGAWSMSEYLRVENIFDKEYIGGVRINDNNLRFFEPAAERNYLLGISASYTF
jgi:iron complex outermembrane receptor protein